MGRSWLDCQTGGGVQQKGLRQMNELFQELAEVEIQFSGRDRMAITYAKAVRILKYFLGNPWVESHVMLSKSPDDFMLNEFDETSENRFLHMDRVIRMADALFSLRNCVGFDALLQRFQDRDARSLFFEATTASSYTKEGYRVTIKRESGVRGKDFDLEVERGSIRSEVEITCKENSVGVSERTISNTLHAKRSQFSGGVPAILYIYLPELWGVSSESEAAISNATEKFFRRSRRICEVIFCWDVWVEDGAGRIFMSCFRRMRNPKMRNALPDDWAPEGRMVKADSDLVSFFVAASRDDKFLEGVRAGKMNTVLSFDKAEG